MTRGLFVVTLFLPQESEQVMKLWFGRRRCDETRENFLGRRLGSFIPENCFATKTVAFHATETIGHQFVSFLVMHLCLIMHPQLRHAQRQSRLNAVSIGKKAESFLVHLQGARDHASGVEFVRLFG